MGALFSAFRAQERVRVSRVVPALTCANHRASLCLQGKQIQLSLDMSISGMLWGSIQWNLPAVWQAQDSGLSRAHWLPLCPEWDSNRSVHGEVSRTLVLFSHLSHVSLQPPGFGFCLWTLGTSALFVFWCPPPPPSTPCFLNFFPFLK